MNVLVPQGIGDSVWAMIKAQSLHEAHKKRHGARLRLLIACANPSCPVEARSLQFLARFDFVHEVQMYKTPIIIPGVGATPEGYYNYIPSGAHPDKNVHYCMMPNAPLERGIPLEQWLPEYEPNWDVMDHWSFKPEEEGYGLGLKKQQQYVCFHMAAISGNSRCCGHNRGPLWTPEQWVELGKRIRQEYDCKIVVTGGTWDTDFYKCFIEPQLGSERPYWVNLTGQTSTGQVLSLGKHARFIISYQTGISMVPNYLGTPCAIWWRPRGDSLHPDKYISFEESMATAWVRPENRENGKFMPLVYGRESVDDIMGEIARRQW